MMNDLLDTQIKSVKQIYEKYIKWETQNPYHSLEDFFRLYDVSNDYYLAVATLLSIQEQIKDKDYEIEYE